MISLVTTVLNDHEGCIAFLEAMEAQTVLPQEIVIVDGGSRDGTWEYLQCYNPKKKYELRCFQEAGCNVARGRNIAIENARNEIVVSTDVGCKWETQWLQDLAQPLLDDKKLEAVLGSWLVRWEDLESDWARIEYAYLNEPKMIANNKSHASSRSIAYRKALWQRIGGYPEDLTLAGDDSVFALLLHKTTDHIACAPIPRCSWNRLTSLKTLCKEARRNIYGAGEAGIWLEYGIMVMARLVLEVFSLLLLIISILFWPLVWAFIPALLFVFLSVSRIIKLAPAVERLTARGFKNIWLRVVIYDYAIRIWSLIGYWKGYFHGLKKCQECRQKLRRLNIDCWST